nr:NCS2 family permease [Allonocardiopsis opalescens]
MLAWADRYFRLTERGSTWSAELRGGLATFFAMSYIVVLNPIILSQAPDATGSFIGGTTASGEGVPMVAAATALVAGLLTIVMGVVGRFPVAIAAGLGLNAVVAFGLASQMTWADAMGIVVIEGVIILILVLTGFRTAVFRAIPGELKVAIGAGIGLFITLIGLVNAGFISRVPDSVGPDGELISSGTVPVQLGPLGGGGELNGWPLLVFVVGVLLTAVLMARRVKGAILIGIVAATVLAVAVQALTGTRPGTEDAYGWQLNVPELPEQIVRLPDLGLLGQFNLLGGYQEVGAVALVLLVFTLMLADFFDTMGTVVGIGREGGLLDAEGNVPNVRAVLGVDSVAAAVGGMASVSSNTAYVESAAGVGEGARTGIANLVTGVLFLLAMFFTPLVEVVPSEAAAPALVVVGFLMLSQIRSIDFSDVGIGIPAFLTVVLMPFTYSIAAGIGAGFVSFVVIRACQGRARDVHPLMWVVAALFVVFFGIEPIQTLLGVG